MLQRGQLLCRAYGNARHKVDEGLCLERNPQSQLHVAWRSGTAFLSVGAGKKGIRGALVLIRRVVLSGGAYTVKLSMVEGVVGLYA